MDPKELRNSSLNVNVSDDSTKYVHSSPSLPANKSKTYNDVGPSLMGKVDATTGRPCAIIGPDRVLPHATGQDLHLKKPPIEPWGYPENVYRQPPDYPQKLSEYQPSRNISPRQTFQENMQRVMVPPMYSSVKNSDDSNLKNSKINMPQEAKYCEVPYNLNTVTNDHKSVRSSDIPMSSVNPAFSRSVPPYGWPNSVNIRPLRPYGAPDFYQYPESSNYSGQRLRSHRNHNEETTQHYPERLYQEANIRFKPYPMAKDKPQHIRYDYVNNYPNTFHPPVPIPPLKYDLQKPAHGHPYPVYPQIKYLDRRIHEPYNEGYQRNNQNNWNIPYRNQVGPPPYGPIPGNCVQNKPYTDIATKAMTVNKHLQFDSNNKVYLDLVSNHTKGYPMPENMHYNDINHLRSEMVLPNHSALNMHTMSHHQVYRRDNPHLKPFDYNVHYRNIDQSINFNYSLPRLPLQFSPNAIAISPSDSTTSIDTTHTISTSQEDCGYVSQSSTASVRSLDINNTLPNSYFRRCDYNENIRNSYHSNDQMSQNHKNKESSSDKKNLDVRQFLQMWNEGEDETSEPTKDITQNSVNNLQAQTNVTNDKEQLYVLGLVNVPSEELSKYEHIQKISKLPENIKGYNNIELLNQYERLVESANVNRSNLALKQPISKDNIFTSKKQDKENPILTRPISPLDVEAKISQSVIHKEVGCNFEIKPCSPEMLNVEVATPAQSILGERIIEKIENPTLSKSPMLCRSKDGKNHNFLNDPTNLTNCNNINNNQYALNNFATLTKPNNYNVQEYNTNSGICLASLPRLDNDIELNFPEINQQFITANKIESNLSTPAKDLPRLDLDHINSATENTISFQQQNILSPQTRYSPSIEKESSKLSKYRKNKKFELIPKEDHVKSNRDSTAVVHQRIDSVIIKNPDNIKLQEDSDTVRPSGNVEENTHQTGTDEKSQLSPTKGINDNICNFSFDTAIDFSLGKIDEEPPCEDTYLEKINNLEFNESFDLSANIENKTSSICIQTKVEKDQVLSEPSEFSINEDVNILSKKRCTESSEANNIPVLKELISEVRNSENEDSTADKQNDISVIIKNHTSDSDLVQEGSLQKQEANILKDVVDSNNTENVEDLRSELKIVSKNDKIPPENQNESDTYESLNEETRLRYNSVNEDIIRIEDKIINEFDESHTKDVHSAVDITENTLKLSKKLTSEINVNITSDENSNLTQTPMQQEGLIIQSEFICADKTNDEEKEVLHMIQQEICNVKNLNSDDTATQNSNTVENQSSCEQISENCTDKTCLETVNAFGECDGEANDKMSEIEYEDGNQREKNVENNDIQNSDVTDLCGTRVHSNFIHDKKLFKSPKNYPIPHIYKELYSPWIQKLYLCNVGYCNTLKARDINNRAACDLPEEMVLEDQEKEIIESVETKNIDVSEKCMSHEQEAVIINPALNIPKADSLKLNVNGKKSDETENDVNFNNSDSSFITPRKCLKRSLSESALQEYKESEHLKTTSYKRRKEDEGLLESHITSEEFCSFIQNNRRNSISTFYTEDNLYIVIDNDLLLTEGNDDSNKIYYAEMSEECNILQNEMTEELNTEKEMECEFSNSIYATQKSVEETWVEDVACIETVVSEDITEDIEYCDESPKRYNYCNDAASDESLLFSDSEHIDKIKDIYGTTMCNDINLLETLYRTPQMDVTKTLIDIESRSSDADEAQCENVQLEPVTRDDCRSSENLKLDDHIPSYNSQIIDEKENIAENIELDNVQIQQNIYPEIKESNDFNIFTKENHEEHENYTIHSNESMNGNDTQRDISNYFYSSSPEVSSTTSEEKSSSILLKITNYNGSRLSQVNEINGDSRNRLSYKLTEKRKYRNYNSNFRSSQTLITKAAQKYIPPLKETVGDLKVKLPLPEHRLNTLKRLKTSKVEPKINDKIPKQAIPKKLKPKFEDVLKSIDEIQFKKHKDKIKKTKNGIPKVIIKKNENGAHYASSDMSNSTEAYNPDLTGRKWQPWVFLEKNNFIDRMAVKNKVRAVFCHRRNTYVLAEKIKKYKSIYNANFVISQPNATNSSKGNLKYTIRLKHV